MTKKVTISVPDDIYARVNTAVEHGHADSVSAFFTHAADTEIDRVALARDVEHRWGPFTADDTARAEQLLASPGERVSPEAA